MAIFDNDGTASREIGKVYDDNGSVLSQIANAYDSDGTVNNLIYQNRVYFYKSGNQFKEITGGWVNGWTHAQYSGTTYINPGSISFAGRDGGFTTAKKIDVTPYSKIVFIISCYNFIAFRNVGIFAHNWYLEQATRYKPLISTAYLQYEIDVSGVSGEYHIGFGCGANGNESETSVVMTDAYAE